MELDDIKMWESILKELWHYPLNSWLVECIKAALKDQGLKYNSDTKKIESIEPEPLNILKGHWYMCLGNIYDTNNDIRFSEGKIYQSTSDGFIDHVGISCFNSLFRPATPEEIPQEPKQENTLKGAVEARKEIITCAEDFQKQKTSDGELTEFEKEIAHVLVYKCYDGNLETEEEIHNAHRQYYDDAKFFAPMLLAKARKQLQPQPRQEWSEEDEQHIDSLLKRLKGLCGNVFERTRFAISEDEDWLESLRPQNKWKPSLAQLNALSIVAKGNAPDDVEEIKSLLNDLKKLKG